MNLANSELCGLLERAAKSGMSMLALGVLACLLLKKINRLTPDEVVHECRLGRGKAYRTINELRQHGYLSRRIDRERGRIVGSWYEVEK